MRSLKILAVCCAVIFCAPMTQAANAGIQEDVATLDALSGGAAFNKIMFTITDGSDAGGFPRISAEGATYEQRDGARLRAGNISLIVINFATAMRAADIFIGNDTARASKDRHSIDGLSIGGIALSAVPLHTSILLQGSIFAGLGAFSHRRRNV